MIEGYHNEDYFGETFNICEYLVDIWGEDSIKVNVFNINIINDVHDIFKKLDLPADSKQLDFGCGPSIHMCISSSRLCSHIVMTEYAAQNRQMVVNWLKGECPQFSWKHIFEHIGKKEGKSPEDIEKRTRSAIKEVLACDTEKDDIFGPASLPQFDVITTCLCLEAACKDLPSYNKTMQKLATYLKPNGYIVLTGILNQSFYMVRDKKFFSLTTSKSDIDKALTAAGFHNVEWHDYGIEVDYSFEYDASGYFTLVAQKQ